MYTNKLAIDKKFHFYWSRGTRRNKKSINSKYFSSIFLSAKFTVSDSKSALLGRTASQYFWGRTANQKTKLKLILNDNIVAQVNFPMFYMTYVCFGGSDKPTQLKFLDVCRDTHDQTPTNQKHNCVDGRYTKIPRSAASEHQYIVVFRSWCLS